MLAAVHPFTNLTNGARGSCRHLQVFGLKLVEGEHAKRQRSVGVHEACVVEHLAESATNALCRDLFSRKTITRIRLQRGECAVHSIVWEQEEQPAGGQNKQLSCLTCGAPCSCTALSIFSSSGSASGGNPAAGSLDRMTALSSCVSSGS